MRGVRVLGFHGSMVLLMYGIVMHGIRDLWFMALCV